MPARPAAATPRGPRRARRRGHARAEAWLLLFPLLALVLLWPALFGGHAIGPVGSLAGFSPWREAAGGEPDRLPQWNVLHWDGIAQFYPWRAELARAFSEGRVPLWNAGAYCGTPFLANSQSAPLYPLHALFALPVGSVAGKMAWLAALHLTLAGAFTWALARWYGLGGAASALAGAAFQLSGFAVAWLPLPSFITVACWLPLSLLWLSRAVRTASPRYACLAGGAIGLMLLGGHLQIASYGLGTLGVVWAAETLAATRGGGGGARGRRLAGAAALGVVAVGLGLALAAAQVLPTLELSRVSHRLTTATEAGYGGYVALAMPPQNWVTLLAPDFFGLPSLGNFWGHWNYLAPNTVEYAGHVGAGALLFSLVGLLAGGRCSRRAWLWAGLALGAVLLAAGTPLNRLLYFGVPGFAQSGSPARCLVVFCLAQALLAGFGLEALLRAAERRWAASLPLLGGALVLLGALGGAALLLAERSMPLAGAREHLLAEIGRPALLRALLLGAAAAGLPALLAWLLRDNAPGQRRGTLAGVALCTAAGGGLWLAGPLLPTGPRADLYPDTPLTTALRERPERAATINREWSLLDYAPAVLPPNASLAYGWRDAQGYDSLALAAYRRLAGAVAAGVGESDAAPAANGNVVFLKDARSLLLPLLGVRWVVSREAVAGLRSAAGFPAGPPFVYDLGEPQEAYAAGQWWEAADGEAVRRLADPARPPGTAVVAPGSGTGVRSDLLPAGLAPATVERPTPGLIRVQAAPAVPSLLVLAEGCAPGWRARVQEQGRPARSAPIVRANVGFQGVFVASGPVTAEWRYEPASFRVGLFFSLTALAALLALGAGLRRPRGGMRS